MLQLEFVGSNQTKLYTKKATILFSYETPVAALVHGEGYVRSAQKYSKTTNKHINNFLRGVTSVSVPQSAIDSLLEE